MVYVFSDHSQTCWIDPGKDTRDSYKYDNYKHTDVKLPSAQNDSYFSDGYLIGCLIFHNTV